MLRLGGRWREAVGEAAQVPSMPVTRRPARAAALYELAGDSPAQGEVAKAEEAYRGAAMDVANVIWCTGYGIGLFWIDLPILDSDGEPIQQRGVGPGEPGLYFVGQHFMSSTMIHGVERDARRVAQAIATRMAAAQPQATARLQVA